MTFEENHNSGMGCASIDIDWGSSARTPITECQVCMLSRLENMFLVFSENIGGTEPINESYPGYDQEKTSDVTF